MMKLLFFVLLGLGLGAFAVAASESASLEAGDVAPPFKLQGSDGNSYSLADFAGKKVVVIAWFPKAFTGG